MRDSGPNNQTARDGRRASKRVRVSYPEPYPYWFKRNAERKAGAA